MPVSKSLFGSYEGNRFLEMELPKREWLIENVIRKQDSVILVGNDKSGKSLFIFQLICSLTSGQPFLDTYNVCNTSKIAYFQLEGELSDSQDRMRRMIKTLEINPELLQLYYYPPLELHNKQYAQSLCDRIEKEGKPDILIIDPIYFAFMGSLSNDECVREFIGNLRVIKDRLGCALILVHHTHKERWSSDGFKIDEGDEAIFGSKFLKAWADHILMFIYDKKNETRSMICKTQRSGDIIKEIKLKLIEPTPLYFAPMEDKQTHELRILTLLQQSKFRDGMVQEDICEILKISTSAFHYSIKGLLTNDIILKNNGRPVIYRYHWEKFVVEDSKI